MYQYTAVWGMAVPGLPPPPPSDRREVVEDSPGATPAPGTAYLASPRRAVTADLLHPGHRAGAVVP